MSFASKNLESAFESIGLALSRSQLTQFQVYERELLRWNNRANLISKRDETRIAARHFIECASLSLLCEFSENVSVLDLGTGGGFPGVPLRIVSPEISLSLLDSRRRKVVFLRRLVRQLDLQGVAVYCERAEHVRAHPELHHKFNFVISRAVADLASLVSLAAPLLAFGGKLIAMKGSSADAEVEALRAEAQHLSITVKLLPTIERNPASRVIFVGDL